MLQIVLMPPIVALKERKARIPACRQAALAQLDEECPQGESRRRDLLRRVCRPVEGREAILPPDI